MLFRSFVYDSRAGSQLPKTAPEWFAQRDGLRAGLANAIEVVPLELVAPVLHKVPLPKGHDKAVAVYAYASYQAAAGQVQGNLTPYRCVRILLAPETISFQACS